MYICFFINIFLIYNVKMPQLVPLTLLRYAVAFGEGETRSWQSPLPPSRLRFGVAMLMGEGKMQIFAIKIM
jgi:hypothetical protein